MQKRPSDQSHVGFSPDAEIDISGLSFEDATITKAPLKATIEAKALPMAPTGTDTDKSGFMIDTVNVPSDDVEPVIPHVLEAALEKAPGTNIALNARPSVLRSETVTNSDGSKARIGDKLVTMGIITPDQLNVALQEKKISGKMLGEVLVDLDFISSEMLTTFLADSSGFEVFNPKMTIMDDAALSIIDRKTAAKYQILPIAIGEGTAHIALSDPYDVVALDVLRRYLPRGTHIKPVIATPQILSDAIDVAYGHASNINDIMKRLETSDKKSLDVSGLSEEEASTHPIVRLVNALISEAVKKKASDLHFEPEENFVRLRYRIDGDLMTAQIFHKQHWNAMAQRLKIMATLNIADKLAPQDGRISMIVGGREVDFRVSSLPTVHGENIVLRILDKSGSIQPLSSLGFSPQNLKIIARAQDRPEGIIIVTGPTGSGKTTSLYSMLNEISTVDINIQTLEDPVEYSLPMIRQTAVREGILEFSDGIRALLRQDPDVIFIGEVRDKTTGVMALQAAMTGHQVYTTLHTNDSFGAIPRLLDLGMIPGMLAGNIIAVFAQRLVRVLCPHCKQKHTATSEECAIMGIDPSDPPEIFAAKPNGCPSCNNAGYKGRIAVAEILTFDEEMDEILARSGTKAEMKSLAVQKGFKSMKDDGILKILEGVTTLDALSKVVDIHK